MTTEQLTTKSSRSDHVTKQLTTSTSRDDHVTKQPTNSPLRDDAVSKQPTTSTSWYDPVTKQLTTSQSQDDPVTKQPTTRQSQDDPVTKLPTTSPSQDDAVSKQPATNPFWDDPVTKQPGKKSSGGDHVTKQLAIKSSRDDHAIKLVTNVASLFDVNNENSRLSDVEITIGNRTFYCHNLVLQINSESFSESRFPFTIVSLQSVNPDHFYEVLKYLYKGKVVMTTDNVESLLAAAYVIGTEDLKKVGFEYLSDSLNIDNALLYWRLALKYKRKKLAHKCQAQVAKDFRKLRLDSSLINASDEMIRAILYDDNLDVKSEVEVCELLMEWLRVRTKAGHEVHPDQLLPLIRWSGMSVNYVKSKLLQNKTLTSDPASINFLSKVITYLLSGVQFEGLRTFHRTSTGLEGSLMTIGLGDGYATTNKVCRISLQHPDRVAVIKSIPSKMNSGSTSCLFNNNVYITGVGGTPYQQAWSWNILSGWIRCTDMITGRLYHCAAVVNSMLYVLGGTVQTDNSTLWSVDSYNTLRNKWSSAGHLSYAISRAAWVTHDNSIYVFGGINEGDHILEHVQVYNPAQESCTLLRAPMPCAFSYIRPILWENCVILLGRYRCFLYDFKTNVWQERKQFVAGVGYFALALDNSTVFIAGGGTNSKDDNDQVVWTCTDEIKSVSVLDIVQDKPAQWKLHARLIKPAMIHSFVNITLPTRVSDQEKRMASARLGLDSFRALVVTPQTRSDPARWEVRHKTLPDLARSDVLLSTRKSLPVSVLSEAPTVTDKTSPELYRKKTVVETSSPIDSTNPSAVNNPKKVKTV